MVVDDSRTIRLLVVEDSAGYLHLIQRAFRDRQGSIRWELSIAQDGEQALRLLFEEEEESSPLPNLILLDWNLPKVSGNEVLRRVKEHPRLRRIPVLVFSSSEAEKISTRRMTVTPMDTSQSPRRMWYWLKSWTRSSAFGLLPPIFRKSCGPGVLKNYYRVPYPIQPASQRRINRPITTAQTVIARG
jgi:CheY-like chemotaxis protein